MKKPIFLFSNGELKRKDNTIYFETEGEQSVKKFLPIESISDLHIFGEINLNKRILEFLSQEGILIHFYNYYGYYTGSFYPREHYNSGMILLKQVEHYIDNSKRLFLAKKFVQGSISNIKRNLEYYKNRDTELSEELNGIETFEEKIKVIEFGNDENSIQELMALEGNVREIYYQCFDKILKDENFSFGSRSKRPPQNKLNALISFGNSLVYSYTLSEIYKTHLDPRIGYLHTTNFRRFTLNLDIAEIFKPILTDRSIFKLINKGMLCEKHFMKNLEGIYLNEEGKKIFVQEMEERMQTTIQHRKLGRKVSYRSLIRMELYKLEKHLLGDEIYEPFVIWW
jgi:CRISPR-associated protein Cas1